MHISTPHYFMIYYRMTDVGMQYIMSDPQHEPHLHSLRNLVLDAENNVFSYTSAPRFEHMKKPSFMKLEVTETFGVGVACVRNSTTSLQTKLKEIIVVEHHRSD